jgi:SulP family sulfate permease
VTIALILATERTQIKRFATPLALIVVTAAVAVFDMDVRAVSDIAKIPTGLPRLHLPTVTLLIDMSLPAIAVALIGVIQGAGVSKSTPNPDGRYPSIARDFIGQGLGNVTSGLFGGVPVGGSVSSTAINIQTGAISRWANFTIGPVIALVLLLFAGGVELIPMASLAAVLVLVGARAVDVPRILAVWHTSLPTGVVMAVTFVATLFMPVHYAVMLGAGLSVVQYVYSSSLDVKVVRLKRDPEGRFAEVPAPEQLSDRDITVLDIYGSIFYAGAETVERMLPDPAGSEAPVVIVRLRGRVDVGSTFLGVLSRYKLAIRGVDGRLMIAGVGDELLEQMERTGFLDVLGRENVFSATPVLTESLSEALAAAERWEEAGE